MGWLTRLPAEMKWDDTEEDLEALIVDPLREGFIELCKSANPQLFTVKS